MMNERQRRARYEREMAALYREIFELRSRVAPANLCPTCARRERQEHLDRFPQGAGIAWERLPKNLAKGGGTND